MGVGCGESGFGNSSHFSRYAEQLRGNTTKQSLSYSGSRSPDVIQKV